jgi:hypothetical protein
MNQSIELEIEGWGILYVVVATNAHRMSDRIENHPEKVID